MTPWLLRVLNPLFFFFLILLGISAESALFRPFPLHYFQPSLILLGVVWCALRRPFTEGGILVLLLGQLGELHSATPRGLIMVAAMGIFLGLKWISQFLLLKDRTSLILLTFTSSALFRLIQVITGVLLGAGDRDWFYTLGSWAIGSAVDPIVGILVFRYLEKLDRATFKNVAYSDQDDSSWHLDEEGV